MLLRLFNATKAQDATNTLASYYTMLVHKDFLINLWLSKVFWSLLHHVKDQPCIPDLGLRLPPYSYSKSLRPEKATVGTNFYIFSIDAVWGLKSDTSPTDKRTLNHWAISWGITFSCTGGWLYPPQIVGENSRTFNFEVWIFKKLGRSCLYDLKITPPPQWKSFDALGWDYILRARSGFSIPHWTYTKSKYKHSQVIY